MTTTQCLLRIEPRGLSRKEAAAYVGVSPTKFDQLVKDGRMPLARAADGRRMWCRYALDNAFDELPEADAGGIRQDDQWAQMSA